MFSMNCPDSYYLGMCILLDAFTAVENRTLVKSYPGMNLPTDILQGLLSGFPTYR
ncbi:hypothetical protein BDZ97DRAFT_1799182 [Flammula alnicola]|nr:hypothetical protein BDZ97DRAFT_1799182 [Flammula alnicola]